MFFDNSNGESIVKVKSRFLNIYTPSYKAKIEGKSGYISVTFQKKSQATQFIKDNLDAVTVSDIYKSFIDIASKGYFTDILIEDNNASFTPEYFLIAFAVGGFPKYVNVPLGIEMTCSQFKINGKGKMRATRVMKQIRKWFHTTYEEGLDVSILDFWKLVQIMFMPFYRKAVEK